MQSRCFHRPQLYISRPDGARKVSWLELLGDLFFVATFLQLGSVLRGGSSIDAFLAFAGLFLPLWLSWSATATYLNRFESDDLLHRSLLFAQLFAVGGTALSVNAVYQGHTSAFSYFHGAVRVVIALLYLRSFVQTAKGREMSGRYLLGHGIGALLWIIAGALAAPWVYVLWGVATAIDLLLPLSAPNRELIGRCPPDTRHMGARYAMLTLFVLGLSFVNAMGAVSLHSDPTLLIPSLAIGLILLAALWWLYFDELASAPSKDTPLASFASGYAHLPLALSLVASGVAVQQALFLDSSHSTPSGLRWLLSSSLALVLLSLLLIDLVTDRGEAESNEHRRSSSSLVAVLLLVLLAPAGSRLPAWGYLAACAFLLVAQVLIALLGVSPRSRHLPPEEEMRDLVTSREDEDERVSDTPPVRHDITSAIRKGTPSELRRDLYYHLMEGSWTRLLLVLLTTFVLLNGIFAALYMLEPGSVNEVTKHSFSNAFFFSVQTMSTIGYGVLSPQTDYANVLVTIEAIVSIFGTAISTGLMFAKASRPRAGVVFTDKIVVNQHHGVPTLMLRTGNARGNEIVEASIRVSALIDEVSAEGHALRRMHDLPLVRSESPLFVLTWQVMHQLDENSPLQGLTRDDLEKRVALIIVTLTGHDATYGQTIHARKMYYPEDFVFDHHFVDILKRLPDGRFLVDYDFFNETESEPETSKPT